MKAMIFAAGRGERMRPLSDHCPKPLLEAGGKALIVWQIEALARAGIDDIVINHAWLGAQLEAALGDGSAFGVRLQYSPEQEALETAGGIAQALPLLASTTAADRGDIFLAVSGDIHTDYDYRQLLPRAAAMARAQAPAMHLVMVPNPVFHPDGDFVLRTDGQLALDGGPRLTFANIALYDRRLFAAIVPGTKVAMSPYYRACIAAGQASGERHDGSWANVGTPAQLAALDQQLRRQRSSSGLSRGS